MVVMAYHHGPVRIAQDNLRSHVNQLIDKEKAALKHLLMNQDTALALDGHHKHHAQKVRGESRPRSISKRHYRPVHKRINHIAFLLRHIYVIPALLQLHPKTAETFRNNAEILIRYILYGYRAPVHGSHADERPDLNHVWKNNMFRPVQALHAVYLQKIRADAFNLRPHGNKQPRKLLHIRFTGSIVNRRLPFRKHRRHENIRSTRHRSLIQKHILPLQMTPLGNMQEKRLP